MPHVEANGQCLYWEESGEGEPLLCVMGLGADSRAWMFQRRAFAERHRTIVFDNRDVGRSTRAEAPYEITDLAADTLAFADAIGLDRFHLLGVSMGGAVSQHLAVGAPERVLSLTLAVTWAGSGRAGELRGRLLSLESERLDRDEFMDLLMLMTYSEAFFENPDFAAQVKQLMLDDPFPQEPEAFARQARASRTHDLRGRLGELPMPCHVIEAEHDLMIPPWKQRELLTELPDGTRHTLLPGAPHACFVEQSEPFNAAVLAGLAALSA